MPSPLKKAKAKAWKVFSKYIRTKYADKDGNVKCVTCPTKKHWKEMQAGHFIQGRGNSILFVEQGCHPQCYSCNVCKHGNLIEYFCFMEKTYGREVIDELRDLKRKTKKMSIMDYQELEDYYKDALVGVDIANQRF